MLGLRSNVLQRQCFDDRTGGLLGQGDLRNLHLFDLQLCLSWNLEFAFGLNFGFKVKRGKLGAAKVAARGHGQATHQLDLTDLQLSQTLNGGGVRFLCTRWHCDSVTQQVRRTFDVISF
jgi:hypothetical protein